MKNIIFLHRTTGSKDQLKPLAVELKQQGCNLFMLSFENRNALSLNDFASIENKVWIGLADKDNMVSLEETTTVYNQLKNCAMYMLPNTKHPIETVNVKLFSQVVKEFN